MTTNNGKHAEAVFESYWEGRGKSSFIYRFLDAGDLLQRIRAIVGAKFPLGKLAAIIPSQPSDYLVVDAEEGQFFAEVKSSKSPTSFPLSNIKPSQWSAAKRTAAAKGQYWFFIYSYAKDRWYRVPASIVLETQEKSLKWDKLEKYLWKK